MEDAGDPGRIVRSLLGVVDSTLLIAAGTCLALSVLASCVLPAVAGEDGRTWIVTQSGQPIATERATFETEDGRWIVSSTSEVNLMGPTRLEQRLVVDESTLRFASYHLAAQTTGGEQTIEAERNNAGVGFHVIAGGRDVEKQGAGAEPILCLDNLIIAHYEVLGREALKHDAAFRFTIAVPQAMLTLPAEFEPGPVVELRIGDEVKRAREAKLTVASLLTRFWYDADDGSAYRVYVPAQELDARIEGWPDDAEEKPAVGEDDSASASEEEVTVASPLGALPCVLTLPASAAGPVPAVMMLSGSGPNDRDEKIGPNKPFRDIARGIAARGIAALRCDKRTALLNREIRDAVAAGKTEEQIESILSKEAAWTLREEYLDDAAAGLRVLGERESIRADERFVLGHSLGALAAAEVAATIDGLRGVILMAGPGRPLDELLHEQLAFQGRLAGQTAEEAEASAREQVAPLQQIREGNIVGNERFMGATAVYWKDVLARDPVAAVARLQLPVLLLQGEEDIQIRTTDYEKLRAALASRKGVPHQAHLFADLNHLFFRIEGESTGAEYFEAGSVDPEVVGTIADWILSLAHESAASPED